jgi:transcriptional regulator with XRE-family HTH domain
MEIDRIIGKRIEKGRRRKGLLQHELGAAVGRSESWVSQVERGVTALDSLSMAERIAGTLGLPVHHVLAFDLRYRTAPKAAPTDPPGPAPRATHPLSFDQSSDTEDSEPMLRRSFTLGSLAGMSAAIAGLSPGADGAP